MTQEHSRHFGNHRSKTKAYLTLVLIAWLGGAVAWPMIAQPEGWVAAELWFAIPCFIFLFLGTANFFLVNSNVVVSQNAISWELFGVEWRLIKWTDVRCIRIITIWDFETHRRIKMYSVDLENRSRFYFLPRGSIFFTEKIALFDELVQLVHYQAEQRTIPIRNEELPVSSNANHRL